MKKSRTGNVNTKCIAVVGCNSSMMTDIFLSSTMDEMHGSVVARADLVSVSF